MPGTKDDAHSLINTEVDMKSIDKKNVRKLYWLFTPMVLVVVWLIVFLWFGVNLLDDWFGWEVDALRWGNPALICSLLIVFIGFGIAAAVQRCWGELLIILFIGTLALLNMTDFFLHLLPL